MNLDKEKLKSVGKGAVIAGAGAVLTYLTQISTQVDFGALGPIVGAVLAVVVNLFRKAVEPKQGE